MDVVDFCVLYMYSSCAVSRGCTGRVHCGGEHCKKKLLHVIYEIGMNIYSEELTFFQKIMVSLLSLCNLGLVDVHYSLLIIYVWLLGEIGNYSVVLLFGTNFSLGLEPETHLCGRIPLIVMHLVSKH